MNAVKTNTQGGRHMDTQTNTHLLQMSGLDVGVYSEGGALVPWQL